MAKLSVSYVNFYEKALDPIVKAFVQNKLPVESVKATNIAKRENGISVKEAIVTFESGQKLSFKIKADGTVFQYKLNGKVLAVKEQFDFDVAFKEVVKLVKQNEDTYAAQKAKRADNAINRLAKTTITRAGASSIQAKLDIATATLKEKQDARLSIQTESADIGMKLGTKQTELKALQDRTAELETEIQALDKEISELEAAA